MPPVAEQPTLAISSLKCPLVDRFRALDHAAAA
jgi:hypothetical protein